MKNPPHGRVLEARNFEIACVERDRDRKCTADASGRRRESRGGRLREHLLRRKILLLLVVSEFVQSHPTERAMSERIKDSPISTANTSLPVRCYLNSVEYEVGDMTCIGGFVHRCIPEYSPGFLSVTGAWKKESPAKIC
jgi:hypothetical protein